MRGKITKTIYSKYLYLSFSPAALLLFLPQFEQKAHTRFFVPEQNCDLRSAITDKAKLIITKMSYGTETETKKS